MERIFMRCGLLYCLGFCFHPTIRQRVTTFGLPGIYVTSELSTAEDTYGIPHQKFRNCGYARLVLELRVDETMLKRCRKRGGVQWMFGDTAAVKINDKN